MEKLHIEDLCGRYFIEAIMSKAVQQGKDKQLPRNGKKRAVREWTSAGLDVPHGQEATPGAS